MISVNQAFSILDKLQYSIKVVEVSLLEARNHVLAETIFSPMNMPPFRQATMDGFAICLHDSLHYEIVGEVKAGDFYTNELKPGNAVKIFTGAAVPNWRTLVSGFIFSSTNKSEFVTVTFSI